MLFFVFLWCGFLCFFSPILLLFSPLPLLLLLPLLLFLCPLIFWLLLPGVPYRPATHHHLALAQHQHPAPLALALHHHSVPHAPAPHHHPAPPHLPPPACLLLPGAQYRTSACRAT